MTSLGNLLIFLFFFVERSLACSCGFLSWATCDESSCQCYISIGEGQRQIINCTAEIPKCFLMKAEMYRLHHSLFQQNKPIESALSAGNELYDPECDSSGLFKARQCNNSDVCWCVDSAGVCISDKSDKNLKCEELVEMSSGHDQIKLRKIGKALDPSGLQSVIASAIQDQAQVSKIKVKYDIDAQLITLDLKNDIGDHTQDLSGLGYYLEKDVDEVIEGTGEKLEMENIVVYYEEEEEEEAPADDVKRLTFGILTVTVVAILAAAVGLIILFLIRKQQRGKYEKAQTSEMEDI
uniref:Epithelial cell adhesion molecule-like n=1 Tax=Astyanax mexicanus TaxID=7994 RepID=W5L944_ASTMX